MSGPQFKFQLPPRELFQFPPDPFPLAIPPPTDARTFASPFAIPFHIYNGALDYKVPITIGLLYATTAIIMNRINRERGNKPWGFSKSKTFHYFVLAHNIFLAIFSALTFLGMIRALAHTWPGRRDLPFLGKLWPGMRTENGLAGATDALCKMHGPRNLGDAVFYNTPTQAWTTTNRLVQLSPVGSPDTADVGRLWNEGLAFWGWWFYLSKFYEVLDTFIILAKGKRSSTLQTYHHTGAMACMWAGIRYMSPPIWMFAFLNSGIHAMMYTYYTLSALRIRVPQRIKRTLTTMQISQFLIGIVFATMHLFVHYSVPVSTPYTWTKTVNSVVSAASAVASGAVHEAASSAAAAVESPGFGIFLKQLLLRAAGEAGMAKKLGEDGSRSPFGAHSNVNITETLQKETKWKTQYEFIPCIDTEGQAFAIWLNVVYLAPLTVLFVRFFIKAYSRRGNPNNKPARRISLAAEDAAHGVNKEVDKIGRTAEEGVGNVIGRINGSTPKTQTPKSQKSEKRRNVSPSIISKVRSFEKSEDDSVTGAQESPLERKQSQDSLRVSAIRRKASEEHNMLRRRFEEGQDFGRSVIQSNGESTVKTKREDAEFRSKSRSSNGDDDGGQGGGGEASGEGKIEENPNPKVEVEKEEDSRSLHGIKEENEDHSINISQHTEERTTSPSLDRDSRTVSRLSLEVIPQTPSNKSATTLSLESDTHDPFTDTPIEPYTSSSPARSTSSLSTQSHIPVLVPSSSASASSGGRSTSPSRKSKIPKLARNGSSPMKAGERSPIKNILTRAKTTPAAVDSTNVSGIGANTSEGASQKVRGLARDIGIDAPESANAPAVSTSGEVDDERD